MLTLLTEPRIDFPSIFESRPGPKSDTFGLPVHFVVCYDFGALYKKGPDRHPQSRGRSRSRPESLQAVPRRPQGPSEIVFQ